MVATGVVMVSLMDDGDGRGNGGDGISSSGDGICGIRDDQCDNGDAGGDDEGSTTATAVMSTLVAADIDVWGRTDILALRSLGDGTGGVGADSPVSNASLDAPTPHRPHPQRPPPHPRH
ncbi:hypothetical protein Tco_0116827 [Tanacetum coccineum]